MVDPLITAKKVASLRARVLRAREKLPESADHFVRDRDRQELVAFSFMIACQEALDLAAHALSDAGREVPATARAHFKALADQGQVDDHLARALANCLGAGNLLAHAYAEVDPARLYQELPGGLAALEQFATLAAGWAEAGLTENEAQDA